MHGSSSAAHCFLARCRLPICASSGLPAAATGDSASQLSCSCAAAAGCCPPVLHRPRRGTVLVRKNFPEMICSVEVSCLPPQIGWPALHRKACAHTRAAKDARAHAHARQRRSGRARPLVTETDPIVLPDLVGIPNLFERLLLDPWTPSVPMQTFSPAILGATCGTYSYTTRSARVAC